MKNSKKMGKSSISKLEFTLISHLKESGVTVFSSEDAAKLLGRERGEVYSLLSRMVAKGILARLRGNAYALAEVATDLLKVAPRVCWPSYVSFWSALSYYGFTEQLPRTIYAATTKRSLRTSIGGRSVLFVRLSANRFFGYCDVGGIPLAEREKAIVDSLLLARYAGGVKEVYKCLCNGWTELDKRKLVDYAVRIGNASVLKRLGYLIEKGKLDIDPQLLGEMEGKAGRGFSKLEPREKKGRRYSKRWRLNLNIGSEELESWRRGI